MMCAPPLTDWQDSNLQRLHPDLVITDLALPKHGWAGTLPTTAGHFSQGSDHYPVSEGRGKD